MGELMDDTTPAAVLARQVRDQILFYPESHQQDVLGIGEVEARSNWAADISGIRWMSSVPRRAAWPVGHVI